MQQHGRPAEEAPASAGAWYRQPVLWLGAAILVASLAGCVWMIVLGTRHADLPLEDAPHPHTLLDMPMHGAESDRRAPRSVEGVQASPSRDGAGARGHRP